MELPDWKTRARSASFLLLPCGANPYEAGPAMDDPLALNPHPSMLRHLRELERQHAGDKTQARIAQDRYLKALGACSTDAPTFTKAERKALIKRALASPSD